MITEIEVYFTDGCGRCDRFTTSDCSIRGWTEGLKDLRRVCLDMGLVEMVKWGHPCYMHAERNIVLIGALRGDFRLSFFNASLMTDPEGILEKQGPNTRHADMFRFTENEQVRKLEPVIRSYLSEAMAYAAADLRPRKDASAIELPEELVEALNADPELTEAFQKLTPGRQRSYVINLASAKASATRSARIRKFRDKIIAGKGATER